MRVDVLTSYILKGVHMLLRFILVPIYVEYLGLSSYGLIGFYLSLEAAMVFFDFGMGIGSNKLLAEEGEISPKKVARILNLIEIIYWCIAVLLGLSIIFSSDFIATHWLKNDDMKIDTSKVVLLMGVMFIVSWPKSLYVGFLSGKKKFFLLNKILLTTLLLQGLLLYLTIAKFHGNVYIYFYVLIGITSLEVSLLRYFSNQTFPRFTIGIARLNEMKSFFKYSSGVALLSVLSLISFQFDKIYISKNFSTSELGVYNLSSVFPFAILTLIYPISTVSFPRIVNIRESREKQILFQKWSTYIFYVIISLFFVLLFNNEIIFQLWIGEVPPLLEKLFLPILLGILFHSTTNMLYNLLLANGKSRLVSIIYTISLIVFVGSFFMNDITQIESMAYSWMYFNICLFIGYMISMIIYFEEMALNYYFKLISIVLLGLIVSFAIDYIWDLLQIKSFLIVKLLLFVSFFGVIFGYQVLKNRDAK